MQSQVILTLALVLLTSCVWVFSLLQHVEHAVILAKADGRIAALEKSNRDLAGLKSELAKIKERPHPAEVEPVSVQHGVELSRRFSGPSPPITGPVSIGNRTDISTASIYDGVGVDPAHPGLLTTSHIVYQPFSCLLPGAPTPSTTKPKQHEMKIDTSKT